MEGSDGGKGVVDSEEGGQGMVALVEGRSECSPCRISNDDDDNVILVVEVVWDEERSHVTIRDA